MKKITLWFQLYDQKIIIILTLILSISSFFYWFLNGDITAYGDSRAHLNIARRVVDSLTPGIAQFGGTWLPLLHILMIPTIWIDFMWQSGISGSIVNMVAYCIGMIVLYKLAYELTNSRLSALIVYVAVALNINILYFQSTPMTEVLFISTLIIALYFLFRWRKEFRITDLIASGFFFFLTSFNRYEGWIVVIGAMIVVGLISLVKFGKNKAEADLMIFSMIACLGIALWFLWQLVIFGNPLDFLQNEFAAGVNTARDIEAGTVPTYKNLWLSILTEMYASFHTSGVVLTLLGFISIILFILKKNVGILRSAMALMLISMIPFLFEVLVVYRGNVPVYVPEIRINKEIPPFFNVRYALYFLPGLALFIAYQFKKNSVKVGILIVLLINNFLLLGYGGDSQILAMKDWGNLKSREHLDAKEWFINNYDHGIVLVSVASSDAFIFNSGLPMKRFISEGSGKYWTESLQKPNKYARWIIIQDSGRDLLVRKINTLDLRRRFTLLEKKGGYRFYKIKTAPLVKISDE